MLNNRRLLSKTRLPLFLLFIFIFTARAVNAQPCGGNVGAFCNPFTRSPSGIKISTLSEALIVVTLYLLSIIGIISLFFMVIAGIKYILSAGNEEKMRSAKNAFCYSGAGLAIAILAYSILFLIHRTLNA